MSTSTHAVATECTAREANRLMPPCDAPTRMMGRAGAPAEGKDEMDTDSLASAAAGTSPLCSSSQSTSRPYSSVL